ncbi:MAG: [protein-PII] uridylyltransferase [Nitriliruptorales bacterium]|nr:[protein-PII] uridylyltransferase [Nitriliruptorales bacterium]
MADVPARLKRTLADLRADGPEPGRAWVTAWTESVDAALLELSQPALDRGRLAVAAVGGYGRRELCPASDVDLLIVHDGLDQPTLEAVVKDVVYPLWDSGLKVGYAVRTTKEAVAMATDLDTATATLDARKLAGDGTLVSDVRTNLLARLRKKPQRFLEQLTEADHERRVRAGDAAEVLEPDLKSGAGGLRDVQSLRWAAGVLVGELGLDPLVSAGYLGAPDRTRLARAYERLLAIRVALHLSQDAPNEVLRMDLQEAVAKRLGYEGSDEARDTPAHRLLRDLYLAARTVDHVHDRTWAPILVDATSGRRRRRHAQAEVNGFEIVDGLLRLPEGAPIDDQDLPIRLMETMVDEGVLLDRSVAAALRRRVEEGNGWAWTDDLRRRFLDVLWRGSEALPVIAEMDHTGVLVAMLPEWEPLRGRAQRNPFHRFALDRHAWHAAANLGDLVAREPWAGRALDQVADRDGLMFGVWLHDVGKAHGEPHSVTGIPVARAIAERMGASQQTQDLVETMIRHHLLLPDAATRRDVSDPALAEQVAEIVGDESTLACLNLLATADGLATGPSAWTSWKASLIASLVTKVEAVLNDRDPQAVADGPSATLDEAVAIGPELGVDGPAVRAHAVGMPDRYLGVMSPRAVVRHAGMTEDTIGDDEVRTRVTPGDDPAGDFAGYDTLDVVARDTPGLFAKVAGVLALHGGSVVTADAFTSGAGLAVDTFVVAPPDHATASWWLRVEGDVAEAIAGRMALRARVRRKAADEQRRLARLPDVQTSVRTADDPAGQATVLEVHTQDRVGVLYAITAAMAELHLDIVMARIQTMGNEVVDSFFVTGSEGLPLDEAHVEELVLAVTAALDEV